MNRLLIGILASITLIASCKKNGEGPIIRNGSYVGTFQRQTSEGGTIVNVIITFNSGNWTGKSEIIKYPALCQGTYQINEANIVFENACAWTAEFDGTLILTGNYKLTANGNTIEITRDYNGIIKDIYKLKKL